MDFEQYWVPRRLDDTLQFFFWDFDGALAVIVCGLLGSLLGQGIFGVVLGFGAGFLVTRGLGRLKSEGGLGVIPRCLYWYTPSGGWLKGVPPSHVRAYIG